MIIHDKPPRHQAYLLRLWEERSQHSAGSATWRFSLEDPRTEERRGFADIESLVAFLRGQMDDVKRERNA